MGSYIFHIDANSAFLSWSAAYRVNILGEKPDLRLIPSIVGGDQEKRHGIALADVVTEEYARHLMLSLCETVGMRLRNDHVKISVVSVHITTCEFQYFNKQMQLLTPTDVTEEIYEEHAEYLKSCGIKERRLDRSVCTPQK